MVNAWGPYNLRREPIEEKIARIDDIGGPATHSNFPLGWAMAANTPLRRYKQNTHGGGIRDPLVISWPRGLAARGELRHQFCHACDLAPTLARRRWRGAACRHQRRRADADRGHELRAEPRGRERTVEGRPRSTSRCSAIAAWCRTAGRRWPFIRRHGLRAGQVGAVPSRPRLQRVRRPRRERARAAEGDDSTNWWREAEAHQVLPLDDRFAPRFADNAKRFTGPAQALRASMPAWATCPTDVAPDVRSRSLHRSEADARIDGPADRGACFSRTAT
jgi:arylsulfatase